jgi:hypothetical protein
MSEISSARQIWINNQIATTPVLARGITGYPEPIEPAPDLRPCVYVDTALNGDLDTIGRELSNPFGSLMTIKSSPEGSGLMEGLLFIFKRDDTISFEWRSRSYHGHLAREYEAAGGSTAYGWEAEWKRGSPGCFMVGSSDASNLWRIHRLETDRLLRRVFVLRPLKHAFGLPTPNFGLIDDLPLRALAEQHWGDVEHSAINNRVASLITSAKQVVEAFLYAALLKEGKITRGNHELNDLLKELKRILDDKEERRSSPFTDLGYHLAHKLRILHAGTHAGRVVVNGRVVTPEFGLTAAQDAVEVLISLGAYKGI